MMGSVGKFNYKNIIFVLMRFRIFIHAFASALALSTALPAAALQLLNSAEPQAQGPVLPVTERTSSVTELVEVTSSPQTHSAKLSRSKSKAQRYVESVSRSEALKSSVFGVLAITEGGDTLAIWNSDQRMVPASTMKLITTGIFIASALILSTLPAWAIAAQSKKGFLKETSTSLEVEIRP